MTAPFSPISTCCTRVTVGVASANVAVVAGRQIVLKAANTNSDNVYVEFGAANTVAAVVPAAGGALGGFTLGPGDMVELTVPAGQTPLHVTGNFLAYISGTAAQSLFISQGQDA